MRMLLMLAVGLAVSATLFAQSGGLNWEPPKTPWGDPDLEGVWTSDDLHDVPLQRPDQYGTRRFLTEEEYAAREGDVEELLTTIETGDRPTIGFFSRVSGIEKEAVNAQWVEFARRASRLTSLVSTEDGKIPPLTEEGKQRRANQPQYYNTRPRDWNDMTLYDRCITRGVTGSFFPSIYGNGTEIVQTPKMVAIRHEMVHETRLIPLDGRKHAGPPSYMGDSVGHFEGNTLVVETSNFLGGVISIGGAPYSDHLKLTERWTRVAPDIVEYDLTVDDPLTFTEPWTVTFPITREDGYQIFEYACHEGNYAMKNRLSAARAEEAEEAAMKVLEMDKK